MAHVWRDSRMNRRDSNDNVGTLLFLIVKVFIAIYDNVSIEVYEWRINNHH